MTNTTEDPNRTTVPDEAPALINRNPDATAISTDGIRIITGLTAPEMPNPLEKERQKRFRPSTFQDMLALMRQDALKEKTDAAKMQKYYALADAFNAIGKLGGSAVGGAIGHNAAESAPAVEPYKESRGYIQAFEKAKEANERLKTLDDKQFALLYDREKTKDARDYEGKVRAEERAYKERLLKLDQAWQKEFYDYKARIEQANTEGNLRLKAQLELELAAKNQEYWKERETISHENNKKLYNIQYGSRNTRQTGVPFMFTDGSHKLIPKNYYNAMINHFIGDTWNGEEVDEDNVIQYMKNNPQLVSDYMATFGETPFYTPPAPSPAQTPDADAPNATPTPNTDPVTEEEEEGWRRGRRGRRNR